jgi:hypothetical protein
MKLVRKKRKNEEVEVVKFLGTDVNFPEIELATIKKSKKRKKTNVKEELENTRLDLIQ